MEGGATKGGVDSNNGLLGGVAIGLLWQFSMSAAASDGALSHASSPTKRRSAGGGAEPSAREDGG